MGYQFIARLTLPPVFHPTSDTGDSLVLKIKIIARLPPTPHPFHGNSPVLIFTPGWRGIVRVNCLDQDHNTMARPGLEPRPLNPESSALITRLPRLPYFPNCVRNHIITFPHPTFINNHVRGLYHPTFFSNSNLPTKIISVVKSYGSSLWGNSLWANLRSSPHGRQNDTVPIWRPASIGEG